MPSAIWIRALKYSKSALPRISDLNSYEVGVVRRVFGNCLGFDPSAMPETWGFVRRMSLKGGVVAVPLTWRLTCHLTINQVIMCKHTLI